MRLNGVYVGLGLGDHSEEIRAIRAFMRTKFSYARLLEDTTEYDAALATVVSDMQARYEAAGKLRRGDYIPGVINVATKLAMGYLKKAKPVVFTVEGHLADMFVGPCAFTAKELENQGIARWQPVGYDNVALPFNNQSGVDELGRLFSDTKAFPLGTPWAWCIFSQGGIVGCRFYLEHIRPPAGRHHNRLNDMRAAIAFGNPYRQKDVIAEWVPDPPKRGTQGISNTRMTDTPAWWKEVSRTGDLYAENPTGNAGEHRTAIYRAVQRELTGDDSLAEQVWEIVTGGGKELWAVFEAIVGGVKFLANMGPHGAYDLGPGIDHLRRRLAA